MDSDQNCISNSSFGHITHQPGTVLVGPDNKEYQILDGPHIIENGDQTYYGFDVVEIGEL